MYDSIIGLGKTAVIYPRVGIGPIKFGMVISEVEKILGQPPQKPDLTPEDDISLDYPDYGVSFLFSAEDDMRLTAIEVFDFNQIQVDDLVLSDLDKNTLLQVLKSRKVDFLEDTIESDISDKILETYVSIPDFVIEAYLDTEDRLSAISMGVYINDDDQIKWPDYLKPDIKD